MNLQAIGVYAAVLKGVLSLMVHGSRIKIWMKGSRLMVQGMKRQNGISKMKSINMGEQYFKGVLAGYLGANFIGR